MDSLVFPNNHSNKIRASLYVALFGIMVVFGCYFFVSKQCHGRMDNNVVLTRYPLCKTLLLATEQTVFTKGNIIVTNTLSPERANLNSTRLSIIVPLASNNTNTAPTNGLGTLEAEIRRAWIVYEQLSASDKIIANHLIGLSQQKAGKTTTQVTANK